MAIGQGFVGVTPLNMACFAASLARGETVTKPTLLHDPQPTRPSTARPLASRPRNTPLCSSTAWSAASPTAPPPRFSPCPPSQVPGGDHSPGRPAPPPKSAGLQVMENSPAPSTSRGSSASRPSIIRRSPGPWLSRATRSEKISPAPVMPRLGRRIAILKKYFEEEKPAARRGRSPSHRISVSTGFREIFRRSPILIR